MTDLCELLAKKEQRPEIPEVEFHASNKVETELTKTELTKIVDLTPRKSAADPDRQWSHHVLWLSSMN